MLERKIGTRDEWQADRDELAKLEAEHAELGKKVTEQRRRLPYIMFGPDFMNGACPGCSNLGDELDPTRVHLNHRDVTLICFSRAPIDRLAAY